MGDVLEEVTADPLSKAHIEARLRDWDLRIEALYSDVQRWVGPAWSASRGTSHMLEEPMRESGVPERALPTLELVDTGGCRATIEPRGLWIIGANGRLDLTAGKDRWLIVDVADNFAPPHWIIMTALDRMTRVDLNQATFPIA